MKKELIQILSFRSVVIAGAIALTAILSSCKSQKTIAPFILRDSISITYKQGTVQPTPSQILCNPQRLAGDIEEQPTPTGVRGAAIESRKNNSAPADGTVGLGATREASVFEGLLSQRTNKSAVPPSPTIRVDTVFVERWHTQTIREPTPPPSGGRPNMGCREGASKFYKNCTTGFFILLLLIIGRIALRIVKAIYLRR